MKNIKQPWEMTIEEFGKLVKTPRSGYKLTGYDKLHGFSGKFIKTKVQELFIDVLSKSQQKQLDFYATIKTDVGRKRLQISYDYHLGFIKQALRQGKSIPQKVLKDYHDLSQV